MLLQVVSVIGEPREYIPINEEGSKVVFEIIPRTATEPVKVDSVNVTICEEVPSESAPSSTPSTSVPPSSSPNTSSSASSAESSSSGEYFDLQCLVIWTLLLHT